MSQCEIGKDCLECSSRGMCSSYADFKYRQGYSDAFAEMKKEFEYLLNSGMEKKKSLEHLIKIADKNIIK